MNFDSIQTLTIDGKEVQQLIVNGEVVWTKPADEVVEEQESEG